MNELVFKSVDTGSEKTFEEMFRLYVKELDEHDGRKMEDGFLSKWIGSILSLQGEMGRHLELCYHGDVPVGFIYGKIDQPQHKGFKKIGYGYIMEFFVLPGYRRKGYGRKMFRRLEGLFTRDGAKRMYLTADNVTGKPFWQALGFETMGEVSPENGMEIYEKDIAKRVNVSVSEFLTPQLAEQIAMAQWHCPDWWGSVVWWLYYGKAKTDCFNVIAVDEDNNIAGRIYCLQNDTDKGLWYYGDLFVAPEYRRQRIAQRMIALMEQTLKDRWCAVLRTYVDPGNTLSLNLQKKLGFEEKPYEPFNDLLNEGQIMFEKQLDLYHAKEAAGEYDASYVSMFYGENLEILHGEEISYKQWQDYLAAGDMDEKHFLIFKGALPCAWLKVNGLEGTDNIGWISMLVVSPHFKHRGIGKYAVKFAEEFLLKAGKTTVRINTTEDNIPAQELYKKCGYSVLAHQEIVVGDGVKRDGIVFEKLLN